MDHLSHYIYTYERSLGSRRGEFVEHNEPSKSHWIKLVLSTREACWILYRESRAHLIQLYLAAALRRRDEHFSCIH